jgi:hypothetical protein
LCNTALHHSGDVVRGLTTGSSSFISRSYRKERERERKRERERERERVREGEGGREKERER